MTITDEWVENHFPLSNHNITLSYPQCRMFGILFPAPSKWRKRIVGLTIEDSDIGTFLASVHKDVPSEKQFDISMHKPNVQPLLTDDGKNVIITEEWLRSWMTSAVGINYLQRKTLGIDAKRKGWLQGLLGEKITKKKAETFMRQKLANIKAPKHCSKAEETDEFIKIFLTSGKNKIIKIIKRMPYKTFLCTPYWKIIAAYEKYEAGKKCALCGSTKMLNVHHKTYEHHGNEAFNLDDLVTVCRECHKAIHGITE